MIEPSNLKLSPSLIPELQKPLGSFFKLQDGSDSPQVRVKQFLLTHQKPDSKVICVGDFVSRTMLEVKFVPDLIIIDNFTQRNKKSDFPIIVPHQIIECSNPQSQISQSAWLILKKVLQQNKNSSSMTVMLVSGEEDLLTLPTIIEAPIGSFVMYGQPPMIGDGSSGIILIEITEVIKKSTENLLARFENL